ncbi:MAG: cation diffusion facilitator family transporter [bacterium]|nr:cation diffusion facilitator family transporter [bacterium]
METKPQKIRIAFYSVLVGITLTVIKLVVGLLTGSLGILSEALHSLLDLVAALITFVSVRISEKPPDAEHPYGHGKIENLSALAEALLLLGTCVWIVYEAVLRLTGKPVHLDVTAWAYAVMGVSLVLDVLISRILSRGAKQYASQALEADALHYSSDILSSAVVIVGLIGVNLGIESLDSIAALCVAVLVAVASLRLSKRAIGELLDRAPSGLSEKITARVEAVPEVRKVEKLRVRQSGASAYIDLTVSARRLLSLRKSHELADRIEAEVRAVSPGSEVMVHFHPSSEDETLIETVNVVAENYPEIHEVHNIQCYREEKTGKCFVSLHVKLALDLTLDKAHRMVDLLEEELRREIPELGEIQTHIETLEFLSSGSKEELGPDQLQSLRSRILKDRRIGDIHDVFVHRSASGTLISCHITTDRDLSLADAHQLTVQVEMKIKAMFKWVADVVVHTEPADPPSAP